MIDALLDTNILLDCAVPDRPGCSEARSIVAATAAGRIRCYASAGSLKDFYYVVRKHVGEDVARGFVEAFLEIFDIAPLDETVCARALACGEPDFEDGTVRAIAETLHVDYIVTRDKDAFRASAVRAVDSTAFAAMLP